MFIARPAVFIALFVLIATGPAAPGQANEDASPRPTLELDLGRLVYEKQGISQIRDKVWSLQPQPGRRLVALPVYINPVIETTELSRSPLKVKAGRFIAFYIPQVNSRDATWSGIHMPKLMAAEAQAFGKMMLQRADGIVTPNQPVGQASQPLAEPKPVKGENAPLGPAPETAPRIARSIFLYPDGSIQWEAERSISGGLLNNASQANPYGFKLDPEQLNAKRPSKPQRITRQAGEDARTFAERRREAQKSDREKVDAFRTLRERVRDLPEVFREPAPPAIFLIFETTEGNGITIDGPAPLPWALSETDLQLYASLTQANPSDESSANLFESLFKKASNDAMAARTAAVGAYRSQLTRKVASGDPGYALMKTLATSNDTAARRVALLAIAQTHPPTLASVQLLQDANASLAGGVRREVQFASLDGALSLLSGADAQRVGVIVKQINDVIADPQGPDARRIVDAVLLAFSSDAGPARTRLSPESTAVLISELSFSSLTNDEWPGVIDSVVARAHENDVAAGWVGMQLLKSVDKERVRAALQRINAITDEPAGASEEGVPDIHRTRQQAIKKMLALRSAGHGLLPLLSSDDTSLRTLAWQAVGRFAIAKPLNGEPVAVEEQEGATVQLYEQVIRVALKQQKTPTTLIDFILNQTDPLLKQAGLEKMVGLLVNEDVGTEAKRAVAELVLTTEGAYNQAVFAMGLEQRVQAVAELYRARDLEPPLVIGLLRAEGMPLENWLGGQFAADTLPTTAQWVAEAGEGSAVEPKLLSVAADLDPIAAKAAGAALAQHAGGTTTEQLEFSILVDAIKPRTTENINEAWARFKEKIQSRVFKEANGAYQLVVTMYPAGARVQQSADERGELDQPASEPPTRIELGLVEFRSEKIDLSLSVEGVELSASPDRLAIRIDPLSSLRTFDATPLGPVPLEQVTSPMDLTPDESGGWAGESVLSDGRVLAVSLEPKK